MMKMGMEEIKGQDNMRAMLAEGLATFSFVFLGTGAVVSTLKVSGAAGLGAAGVAAIALAHGLAILLLVAAFGRISGAHINPAVTFAAFLTGRIGMAKGVAYVIFQLAGAVVASLVLKALIPNNLEMGLGRHGLSGVSPSAGFGIEIVLTFFLVWVVLSVAMDKRGPGFPIAPVAIGLVVLVDHLVGVPLTGASMNPARSFGPALVTKVWTDHWVYWLGPLAGAAIAAVLYTLINGKEKT